MRDAQPNDEAEPTLTASPDAFAGDVRVRLYESGDERAVVDVLQAAFGDWPTDVGVRNRAEHFRWKHLQNPLGRSLMVVAVAGTEVIGFAGWLPFRVTAGGRRFNARRGVDLAVRPEHRGRGVARALTRTGTAHLPQGTAFTLSDPNAMSRSGVLRLGRREIGRFPIYVRICKPVRVAMRRGHAWHGLSVAPRVTAETAAEALADRAGVTSLLKHASIASDRLSILKDIDYLSWRYGGLDDYRAVSAKTAGQLRGVAIFRVRSHGATWSSRICELIVLQEHRRDARQLLRDVLDAAAVDYATCHFPSRSLQRQAAIRCGFLPLRAGKPLLAYPLHAEALPDLTRPGSWALTLGDLDLL